MLEAYVLLNVDPGAVLERLKTISVVHEAYVSYGVYDLIIKVKAETMDELKDAISHKIRTTDQVKSTVTLILMAQ